MCVCLATTILLQYNKKVRTEYIIKLRTYDIDKLSYDINSLSYGCPIKNPVAKRETRQTFFSTFAADF
jgi:hypothetical protein